MEERVGKILPEKGEMVGENKMRLTKSCMIYIVDIYSCEYVLRVLHYYWPDSTHLIILDRAQISIVGRRQRSTVR